MSIVRSYNPIWSFVDLNGQQLHDTYYLFTLQNTLPYLPQPIWQDAGQVNQWNDPIQFLANGTLPENMYWDNTLTYRLEVRNGPTQADALIYLVENYQPSDNNPGPNPNTGDSDTENQITNPQFGTVNFTRNLVITTASTTVIAPGWSVITTGTGILTLSQSTYTGSQFSSSNPTNASTGLRLINNGFSTVELIQRYNGNGALWTGESVAFNITASSTTPALIRAFVKYNDGAQDTSLLSQLLTSSNTEYTAAVPIPVSSNTTQPSSAWTELSITITTNTTYEFTSIQLVGQKVAGKIPYLQTTPQRQIDEEFNYYFPQLEFMAVDSLLTGWDFAMNPAQELGWTQTRNATPAYSVDQTIIASVSGNLNIIQGSTGALSITTTAANQAFYLLQYLTGKEAVRTTLSRLSVNLSAFAAANPNVTAKVYLYNGNLSSVIPTLGSTIGTIDNLGAFTLTALNWSLINQTNGGTNQATLAQGSLVDIPFSGWDNGSNFATCANFAIVVTFAPPTSGTNVIIQSIGLTPGDIPTRPAPKTLVSTLLDCYFYYESTYDPGVIPGTSLQLASARNAIQAISGQGTTTANAFPISWGIDFAEKVKNPTVTIYAPNTGAAANVYGQIFYGGALIAPPVSTTVVPMSNWLGTAIGKKSITFVGQNTAAYLTGTNGTPFTFAVDGFIYYHATIDARLGK